MVVVHISQLSDQDDPFLASVCQKARLARNVIDVPRKRGDSRTGKFSQVILSVQSAELCPVVIKIFMLCVARWCA
jgi:hypothetical protein